MGERAHMTGRAMDPLPAAAVVSATEAEADEEADPLAAGTARVAPCPWCAAGDPLRLSPGRSVTSCPHPFPLRREARRGGATCPGPYLASSCLRPVLLARWWRTASPALPGVLWVVSPRSAAGEGVARGPQLSVSAWLGRVPARDLGFASECAEARPAFL